MEEGREREGRGREGERGMRGVCACVRVYVCTCVEGGREGEKEGGRSLSVCVHVSVHVILKSRFEAILNARTALYVTTVHLT